MNPRGGFKALCLPRAPQTFHPSGLSRHERERKYERERSSTSVRRLYNASWARASAGWLKINPLCRYCDLDGEVNAATLVDHFWPHRGDRELFWDSRFWIESCDGCHSGMKQATERAGEGALLALSARLGLPPKPWG
jgi:5-methylcytosine-specific restriction protein A